MPVGPVSVPASSSSPPPTTARRSSARRCATRPRSPRSGRRPASGIAALYLWGLRWWPGVFLGELVVNAELLARPTAAAVGSLLGQQTGQHGRDRRRRAAAAPADRPARRARPGRAGRRHARGARDRDGDQRDRGHAVDARRRRHRPRREAPTFWRTWWLGDTSGGLVVLPADARLGPRSRRRPGGASAPGRAPC